tara:strand:- start:588 stop:1403 length:816 start_codon:yes stop_codon:yes gene_type:complete
MTMMEDFNQWSQPMAQPVAPQVQPMAQPSSFAPEGGMLGEMVDERMQWQSPARNQILQDFNLSPATTGAGFQMQGTNTPTAVTDLMATGITGQPGMSNLTYLAGTPAWTQGTDPSQNISAHHTGFFNPANQSFDLGTVGGNTISSIEPNRLALNVDMGNYGLVNPIDSATRNMLSDIWGVSNPNFPMGGTYNYFTDPRMSTGWPAGYGTYGLFGGIPNFDPYNALANTGVQTGMAGYMPTGHISQPFFNIMEGGVPQPSGSYIIDPFQNFR